MFTSCPTVCPEMTRKMQTIQKRVRGLGQAIALVSFSVDPKTDTSPVLYKYAQEYRANHYIWSFLTGSEDQLKNVIINNMKLPFITSNNLIEITHSEKLVLMDKLGNIRGYYQADTDGINQLMIDTGLLINNAFRTI
jgi:protein SCO1/2